MQSTINKTFVLNDLIKAKDLDLLFMNETWQSELDDLVIEAHLVLQDGVEVWLQSSRAASFADV